MNVKGLQNEFSVLYENLNPESKSVESPRRHLSPRPMCVHTEEHTHPNPPPNLPQNLSRPAFNLKCVVKTQS